MTLLEGLPIVTPARAIAGGIEIGLRQTLIDRAIETAAREALITRATAERLRAAR